MIIADKNEPEELRKIAHKVEDLGFDYWIVGEKRQYVIERKTLTDMVGSIRGKAGQGKITNRFFEQLERIKMVELELRDKGYDAYALVVLEGNIFQRYRARFAKLLPQQWFGIQAKIAELGVGLIRTWSIDETKLMLQVLDKRAGKEVTEVPALAIEKRLRDIREEAMHVLMAITGIGVKKAKELLSRYGSVKAVLMANERDLAKIVGEKLAKHIKEVVEYKFVGGLGR